MAARFDTTRKRADGKILGGHDRKEYKCWTYRKQEAKRARRTAAKAEAKPYLDDGMGALIEMLLDWELEASDYDDCDW